MTFIDNKILKPASCHYQMPLFNYSFWKKAGPQSNLTASPVIQAVHNAPSVNTGSSEQSLENTQDAKRKIFGSRDFVEHILKTVIDSDSQAFDQNNRDGLDLNRAIAVDTHLASFAAITKTTRNQVRYMRFQHPDLRNLSSIAYRSDACREDIDLFSKVFKRMLTCEHVQIAFTNFNSKQIDVASTVLRTSKLQHLKSLQLNLSGTNAAIVFQQVMQGLAHSKLEQLDLSDNLFSLKDCELLANFLKGSVLESLNVSACRLNQESSKVLFLALPKALHLTSLKIAVDRMYEANLNLQTLIDVLPTSHLLELDISRTSNINPDNLSNAIALIQVASVKLQRLNASQIVHFNCKQSLNPEHRKRNAFTFGYPFAQAVAAVLRNPDCTLTDLDLGFNRLSSAGILAILGSLENSKLRSLNFSNERTYEPYDPEFVSELIKCVRNSQLEHFGLHGCDLTEKDMQVIADALPTLPLKSLDVSHNGPFAFNQNWDNFDGLLTSLLQAPLERLILKNMGIPLETLIPVLRDHLPNSKLRFLDLGALNLEKYGVTEKMLRDCNPAITIEVASRPWG